MSQKEICGYQPPGDLYGLAIWGYRSYYISSAIACC